MRDYARKSYMTDSYREMLKTIPQKAIFDVLGEYGRFEKQSMYKKPYLMDSYQQMENVRNPVIPYVEDPYDDGNFPPIDAILVDQPEDTWDEFEEATAAAALPVAAAPWFYDDFDIIDGTIWTEYTYKGGVSSIESGRLKQVAATAAGYTALWAVTDDTIPEAFDLTFEMNHSSGAGVVYIFIYLGTETLLCKWTAPTTINFREAGGFTDITIDTIAGTTETWKLSYNGTTCAIYRDSTLIRSGLTLWASAGNKGRRIIHTEAVATIYFDDYTITPL